MFDYIFKDKIEPLDFHVVLDKKPVTCFTISQDDICCKTFTHSMEKTIDIEKSGYNIMEMGDKINEIIQYINKGRE